jgi:DNA-binding SARP family transcriptional activator
VDYRILGPLEVSHEGRDVPVSGVRQRRLLADLLLHAGEVVSTDRLLEDVWEDEPPAAGATALRVRISQLRRTLPRGPQVVQTRAPGYVLVVDAGALDVRRFEHLLADGERALAHADPGAAVRALDEALGLWRGPPLAELGGARFAEVAIARLEELRLAALELRMEAALAAGRHAAAVAELRALVAQHPLRERLCGQLMVALYRDGRQAEALDAYRATRRRLVEELGIEPGPQLRAVERQVLGHDARLDRAPVRPARLRRVLVALPGAPWLRTAAEDLARHADEELLMVAMPDGADRLARVSAELNGERERLLHDGVAARVAAFTSTCPERDLCRVAIEQEAALVILDATGRSPTALRQVLSGSPCDVAFLAAPPPVAATPATSVLVPFGGHEHDWAAVETAAWLAASRGWVLRLLGVREGRRRDASRLLANASLALQRGLGIAAEAALVAPGAAGVIAAATGSGALVVGVSNRWSREGLGVTRATLAAEAPVPVLFVRGGIRPGGLAPASALTRFTWSLSGPTAGR